jgi:hypothetical protein
LEKFENIANETMRSSFLLHTKKALLLLASILGVVFGVPLQCREPSEAHLHTTWAKFVARETNERHESVYMIPKFSQRIQTTSSASSAWSLLNQQPHCNGSDHINAELNQRSVCAWSQAVTESQDRYPRRLVEARRSSQCDSQCLGGVGQCAELVYPVAILKKSGRCDDQGFFHYEGAWHQLVVGFACVANPGTSSH